MRCRLAFVTAILALVALGCGRQPVGAGASTVSGQDSYVRDFSKLKPAYQLPWEKKVPGKADQYDDYRAAHPQWYAFTVPPAKPGFRAMQEWEPMDSVILTYSDYMPGDEPVSQTLADIVAGSYLAGKVFIIYSAESAKTDFTARLVSTGVPANVIGEGQAVQFVKLANDAIWMIDFGPLPLVDADNNVAFLDWRYYHERVLDDGIPTQLGQLWGYTTYRQDLAMEGGNFQADGFGTCYTTERELENTGLTSAQLASVLKSYAGCETLVVLKDLNPDGTGHIDMFFKLFAKDGVVLGSYTAAQNTAIGGNVKADMDANQTILEGVVVPGGGTMTVHRLPMPNAGTYGGEKIPRTYINSTLFNGVNLWPNYSVDKDIEADAVAAWQTAMPTFTHTAILSDAISLYSGTIHCVTRTIPAGNKVKWVEDGDCANGVVCTAPAGGYAGACKSDADCFGPAWIDQCTPACDGVACGGDDGCGATCGCPVGQKCASGACVACTPNCGGKQCGDDGCGGSCGECGPGTSCNNGVCQDPCLGITYEGCCDGETVKWCENGAIQTEDCNQTGPKCGWNGDASYYYCGTDGGADPSGAFPKDCVSCDPNCEGKACDQDDGCGMPCGCPQGQVCENSQCVTCEPQCEGKVCGDNGCGGTCGECQDGQFCSTDGTKCVQATLTQCLGTQEPSAAGCDVVATDQGCCSVEGWVIWCQDGNTYCIPCSQAEDPAYQQCGWSAQASYYDCGTNSNPDPTGTFPLECTVCEPSCAGKTCDQDNGCGKPCGCPAGQKCEDSACVACQPECDGKQCGPDGCGGTCGDCGEGLACDEQSGQCTDPCMGVTYEGCCDGTVLKYCEDGQLKGGDCAQTQNPQCGWNEQGWYDCGASSAADPSGTFPIDCPTVCVAQCDGKVCGPDGCGGQCGLCGGTETCVNGQCQPAACTDECAAGESGCVDQATAWTCGEGDNDSCREKVNTACTGNQVCVAGVCQEHPVDEVTEDVSKDTTLTDNGTEGTTGDTTGNDETKPPDRDGGGGCVVGGFSSSVNLGSLALLLLALAGLVRARRFSL
jgi:agmatine/peptidylarginine deiminase